MTLIHDWLNPNLEVKSARGNSYKGIFAIASVSEGERVAIFGGHVMKIEDTDFFNHSCNPNAGFKGQIFLIAMKDIRAGEEVAFDYAMVLHEAEGMPQGYEFTCHCSSPNCRGKVTNNDWKMPDLQKKYDGYFSWYLQEKINRIEC